MTEQTKALITKYTIHLLAIVFLCILMMAIREYVLNQAMQFYFSDLIIGLIAGGISQKVSNVYDNKN